MTGCRVQTHGQRAGAGLHHLDATHPDGTLNADDRLDAVGEVGQQHGGRPLPHGDGPPLLVDRF
jgi:hypothetical protein